MITNEAALLQLLTANNLTYDYFSHRAIFTSKQASEYYANIPGAHVKNLFLRDKKKKNYILLTVKDEKRLDLEKLSEQLQLGRLSFASAEDLNRMLGVEPGSVTPIAILNNHDSQIKLFFDQDLLQDEYISIHPMINTATICLKLSDLLQFIAKHSDNEVHFIDLPT